MRTSEIFILGTIAGAVAVWVWGRHIESYVGETTRDVRAQAAATIQAVDEKTGRVLDRGGKSLRRAEHSLQGIKERLRDTLKAGRRVIRPTPTTEKV